MAFEKGINPRTGLPTQPKEAAVAKENQEPDILYKAPEPSVPLSEVQKMMEAFEAKIMANLPKQNTSQTPAPVFMQKDEYNIDKDIPEFDNWEIKPREYRLLENKRPITYSLQRAHNSTNALQYFNKATGKTHTMRYSSNQPSFFIENQSTNPADIMDAEILFNFGKIYLGSENTNMQKFLTIHPQYGVTFKEYDHTELSRKFVADKKAINKANALVETVGDLANRSIASLVCPSYIDAWTTELVEEAIFKYVETNPVDYINYTNDPSLKLKGIAKSALAKGYLTYSNYRWMNEDKQILLEVSKNQNEFDEIAKYFGTGEGRSFYEFLVNAIN